MRLLPLPAVLFLAGLSAAAEFPPVDKLPAHKDLPDPLVFFDGKKVEKADQWPARRAELKELFQHYMYGRLPDPVKVTAKVEHSDDKAFGGKATLKEVALSIGVAGAPPIRLLLVVPNQHKGPVPAFVGLNFSGNHTLVDDPKVKVPEVWMYPGYPGVKDNRASEEGRGKLKDVWALEQSIDRGYAVATCYNGDIDPDNKDKRGGLRPYLTPKPAGGPDDTATIAAWAWGVQRLVDYLIALPEIDSKRIAVVGHSRLGKTALVAAAFDDRIALSIPHQAGCGGTAPSRGTVGESVEKINTNFPHWFCDSFKEFNKQVERLPFDQNCLAAPVAPRPLLFSNAEQDTWANPDGQFEVLEATTPVYRLLGAEGLGSKEKPALGKLLDSRLGYYIRAGKHSMLTEDWKVFLDFADKHFRRPVGVGMVEVDVPPREGEKYRSAEFRMWLPPGVKTVRAVIIHQHGCGRNGIEQGEDLQWRALAAKHDAALLGTWFQPTRECADWSNPAGGSERALLEALKTSAEQTGHPELVEAPWALWGHSGGAAWVMHMTYRNPGRVVGTFARSGAVNQDSEGARAVPVIFNYGEREKTGRFVGAHKNSTEALEANRPKGALWAMAVDPKAEHDCRNSRQLAIPFFDAVLAQRLPPAPDKPGQKVALRPLDPAKGWLGDPATLEVAPADKYSGDKAKAYWLPDEKTARCWQEFCKTGEVVDRTPPAAPTGLKAEKAEGGVHITWSAVADLESGLKQFHVYRGGKKIASVGGAVTRANKDGWVQVWNFGDEPEPRPGKMEYLDSEPDGGPYEVVAENGAGLTSERSAAVKQ